MTELAEKRTINLHVIDVYNKYIEIGLNLPVLK